VDYHDVNTGAWLRFFEEMGTCSVMNVTLQGGEPFMREDLPELIAGIVRNRMRFSILSNGGLITDDAARFIADTGRCDSVQISVDGSCPDVHDTLRGKGAFEGAMRGIDILRGRGAHVSVRVTIHRQNYQDLENIARLLIDDLGLDGFSTNSAIPLGSCRLKSDAVLLDPEAHHTAMETLLKLWHRYDGKISASAGPLALAWRWHQMETARLQGAQPFSDGGYLTGCGCTAQKLAVRADGTLIPCTMLPDMALGRINQDRLADVWRESPILNRLRTRHQVPLEKFEFCAGCPYIPYCTGNCPGAAASLTGQDGHPSPDACLRNFLMKGGRLPDPCLYPA
jgi:SynChlorMet cassette radical SAM/SPASM protein ScmE